MSKYKNNQNYFLDPVSKRWKKKDNAAESYAKQVIRDAGMSDMEVEYLSPQVTGGGEVPASMVAGDGELHCPIVDIYGDIKEYPSIISINGNNEIKELHIVEVADDDKREKELFNVSIGELNIYGESSAYEVDGDGLLTLGNSTVSEVTVGSGSTLDVYEAQVESVNISGNGAGGGVTVKRGNFISDSDFSYEGGSSITFHNNYRKHHGEPNVRNAYIGALDSSEVNIMGDGNFNDVHVGVGGKTKVEFYGEFDESTFDIGSDSYADFVCRMDNVDFHSSNDSDVIIRESHFENCTINVGEKSNLTLSSTGKPSPKEGGELINRGNSFTIGDNGTSYIVASEFGGSYTCGDNSSILINGYSFNCDVNIPSNVNVVLVSNPSDKNHDGASIMDMNFLPIEDGDVGVIQVTYDNGDKDEFEYRRSKRSIIQRQIMQWRNKHE